MKKFNLFKMTKPQSSIEGQVIQKFITVVAILLFVMWVVEIVFFTMFYENVKLRALKSYANEVIKICEKENYQDNLNDYSFENNINVIIANKTGDNFEIKCSSNESLDYAREITKVETSYSKMANADYVTYDIPVSRDSFSYKILVYFAKIQPNSNYYVYIETISTPLTSTNEVFVRLLIMVSVVGFIVAMFLSYFLSKSISDPIQNLSKKAEQLSSGDFSVKFDSREYREVDQLSETLNYSVEEINKSQALQHEVICNITHELKTPLTMIQSYAELINDISGDNKEKREEHLKVILEETNRLNYMVDDIMQYSKLETGLIKYELADFDIIPMLKKLQTFYMDTFKSKGYDFEFVIPNHKVIVCADEKRIEQVVINLLNNAINYSNENKNIKISLIEKDGIAQLSVRDHGMGIEKEDIDRIFDKHFRSVGARRVSVGSGIGLSIVKSILTYHNFNYGVKSEVGKGSVFYFSFPVKYNDEEMTKIFFEN